MPPPSDPDPADSGAELDALAAAWRGGYFDSASSRARAAQILRRATQRGDQTVLALGAAYEALFSVVGESAVDDPWPALDRARDALVQGGDEPDRAAWMLSDACALAVLRHRPGDAARARELLAANLQVSDDRRPPHERIWTQVASVIEAVDRRDFDGALAHGSRAMATAEAADDAMLRFNAAQINGYMMFSAGDLDAAETLLLQAWKLMEDMGRFSTVPAYNLALLLALRGRPQEAAHYARHLQEDPLPDMHRAALALIALESGDVDEADRLLPSGQALDAQWILAPVRANAAWVRARIDLAQGRSERARQVVTDFFVWLRTHGLTVSPMNAANLSQALATACEQLGDHEGALQALHAGASSSFRWMADSVQLRMQALAGPQRETASDSRHVRRRQRLDEAAQQLAGAALDVQTPPAPPAAAAETPLRLLANVSHEMRTPISGVIGMTTLLSMSRLDASQRRMVDLTRHSAQMLLNLCNNLLDLAKLGAGRFDLQVQPFDLRALVQDTVGIVEPLVQAQQNQLDVQLSPELPVQWLGDALRIRQILTNLLGNAVKFTRGGRIELRVQSVVDACGREVIAFEVRDTGTGIDEATQARLFREEFVQADPGIAAQHGGTGLGLALCRQLVDLMGGTIGLTSRLGHGSTFRVELPLSRVTATDASGGAGPPHPSSPSGGAPSVRMPSRAT